MKIVVTGATGLLGWHISSRIHARNCASVFAGEVAPFDLVRVDRTIFNDAEALQASVAGGDAVIHCAGQNRGAEAEVEVANPAMAEMLLAACSRASATPHIVYANSIHAGSDTPYGRSKGRAGERLATSGLPFTDLVLPHIFGEGARPNYNNVTATFIDHVIKGSRPSIDPAGRVELLHAGAVADLAIGAVMDRKIGTIRPSGHAIAVPDLFDLIELLHRSYERDVFPTLQTAFELALFNSYRSALYPNGFPRHPRLNDDVRGRLFEAVKGGGGGQTFVSWTEPGATRGNHFHLGKVERFLVLEGEGLIRMRCALGTGVTEYRVSGATPAVIDMPTLVTHSIENVGKKPLLTLFWTNEIFDPAAPDTYRDDVLGAAQ